MKKYESPEIQLIEFRANLLMDSGNFDPYVSDIIWEDDLG